MKHGRFAVSIMALTLLAGLAPAAQQDTAKTEIRQAIDAAYLNAYWNDMDIKALVKGWDYGAISQFIAPDDQMSFVSMIDWFGSMTARKAPAKKEYTFLYPVIDVVGDMAMAKVEVMKGETIEYTDYFPLFRTKTGWKIVAYPFYPHRNGVRPETAAAEAEAVKKTVEDTIVGGLLLNGTKEQILAGLGEVCDLNRYVPELDAVAKQSLGSVLRARSAGLKAPPVKSHDVTILGITGNVAAAKLALAFEPDRVMTMYLALYKTRAGWKIVELTSDKPLMVMFQPPRRPQAP